MVLREACNELTSTFPSQTEIVQLMSITKFLMVHYFPDINQALCACLSTPTDSTFLGSVLQVFRQAGHHKG